MFQQYFRICPVIPFMDNIQVGELLFTDEEADYTKTFLKKR